MKKKRRGKMQPSTSPSKTALLSIPFPRMKTEITIGKPPENAPTISKKINIESRKLPGTSLDISKMTAMKHQAMSLLTSEMKPSPLKHLLLENVLNPGNGPAEPKQNTRTTPLQLARP